MFDKAIYLWYHNFDFLGGGIVMYEENRRFSWTGLFIKIIIVIIFVLFTIWLLSLSMKSTTKGMSNGISVLTDGIFSQNIEKMKDVNRKP